jgi:uncharacterized protein (DUF169 family)
MIPLQTDLSIFNKFNFDKPPVGVKFLFDKPEEIEKLDKSLAFCEMVKEAQHRGTPFYIDKDSENCFGTMVLGMKQIPSVAESGQIGPKDGIFKEPRANSRIYQHIHKFSSGVVNYVAFSSLGKLTFEPDLLILLATPSQTEIIMRAMSYSNGDVWESNVTPALGCSWLFVYPYQTGKVNYVVTGTTFGMKAHKVFPEGWILISIPYDRIPTIVQNLKEMNWVLTAYTESREEFMERKKSINKDLI